MEKLTSLNENNKTQVSSIKQSPLWAKNQAVLNGLSETYNGFLAYKGLPVSSEASRLTQEFFSGAVLIDKVDNNTFRLYTYEYGAINEGSEIKAIRIRRTDGQTVDIRNMAEIDNVPYILNMHNVYITETGEMVFALVTFLTDAQNVIISEIESQSIEMIEVDYCERK